MKKHKLKLQRITFINPVIAIFGTHPLDSMPVFYSSVSTNKVKNEKVPVRFEKMRRRIHSTNRGN